MSLPVPHMSLTLGQISTSQPRPITPVEAPATPPTTNNAATGTTIGTVSTTGPATQEAVNKGNGGFLGFLGNTLPIILMFVVLYFILFRGQRKEEKRRKATLSEMKKGDRVMTIGGLVARVVSIDGDEVVLKIDESANVKATYKKSSIQQVLPPADEKTK